MKARKVKVGDVVRVRELCQGGRLLMSRITMVSLRSKTMVMVEGTNLWCEVAS